MKRFLINVMHDILGVGAMIIVMFTILIRSIRTSFIKLFLVLIGVSVMISSCIPEWNLVVGEGETVRETVPVNDGFTAIELQSYADVIIEKGVDFKVEISDYENLIDYMDVRVSNGKLIIKTSPAYVSVANSDATVRVTMPDTLNSILLSGSGDVEVNDAFNKLQILKISGSGDIELESDAQYEHLQATISGSGKISGSGTAVELETLISGSGYIRFEELTAKSAQCTISGSGNTYVSVVINLGANISGSGSVIYYGNPSIDSSVTGSGRIRKG
ncbi:MAG: head GIN domain-containing protein [Paludibacter sp.]|nr:head GIN domain-containing protein [Paludibacter sp.]